MIRSTIAAAKSLMNTRAQVGSVHPTDRGPEGVHRAVAPVLSGGHASHASHLRWSKGEPWHGAQSQAPGPCDLLGFGHPRLDDGNFDGIDARDLGAIEFGGLIGTVSTSVGGPLEVQLWGPPGAPWFLYLGSAGAALDLWSLGSLFLDASAAFFVAGGLVPPTGSGTLISTTAPAALLGFVGGFQAVVLLPGSGPHLTNLESISVTP